jgi:hypothetical protein
LSMIKQPLTIRQSVRAYGHVQAKTQGVTCGPKRISKDSWACANFGQYLLLHIVCTVIYMRNAVLARPKHGTVR